MLTLRIYDGCYHWVTEDAILHICEFVKNIKHEYKSYEKRAQENVIEENASPEIISH